MRVPEIMPCDLDFPNVIALQSSAAQPRIRVTFHSGHDGLLGLREIWGDLLTRLPRARFFHEWVWYRAYLQHLELTPENVSFALLAGGSGVPLAIVPLQKTSISFHGVTSRLWRLPEHTHMPLADVIAAQGVSGAELVAALLAAMRTQGMHWDRVQFTGFTEESCLNCAALAGGRALHRDVLTSSDQVVCNLPWEVFATRFSPNFRSNLNKARHKIERAGGATYEVTNDPVRVEALFPEFLRVEASGWKGASGTRTAIACDPRAVEFYRALMESWEPSGRVFINVMHFAGRVIASQFCLCDTDTVFILKLGYDESFAHVAPGNSLLEQLVRWCCASPNLHKINLAGQARWFQDWHPEPNNVYRVHLFNRTPIGQIHRIKCAAQARLRLLAGARHRRAQNTERAAAAPRGGT
jgi:Acetyltransferase (GNAT) domain